MVRKMGSKSPPNNRKVKSAPWFMSAADPDLRFLYITVSRKQKQAERRKRKCQTVKPMRNVLRCALLVLLAFSLTNQAFALLCPPGNPPTNCAPPTGAILDLNGTAIPHVYTQYSVNFVAASTSTNISFAFRDDPAFLLLDNVSVTTGGGPNLLLNSDFDLGPVGATSPRTGLTSTRLVLHSRDL